jgi:hypothetical protein
MLYPWMQAHDRQLLLEHEAAIIERLSQVCHAQTSLLLDKANLGELITNCHSQHKLMMSDQLPSAHLNQVGLCLGDIEHLPFMDSCSDFLILPHIVEDAQDPKACLSEVSNLVTPEGYILLLHLLPFSHWRAKYKGQTNKHPIQWIKPFKLRQWLNKLGFEYIASDKFINPFSHSQHGTSTVLEKIISTVIPSICNAHWMLAKKRQSNAPLIRLSWQSRRDIIAASKGLANVSLRELSK